MPTLVNCRGPEEDFFDTGLACRYFFNAEWTQNTKEEEEEQLDLLDIAALRSLVREMSLSSTIEFDSLLILTLKP